MALVGAAEAGMVELATAVPFEAAVFAFTAVAVASGDAVAAVSAGTVAAIMVFKGVGATSFVAPEAAAIASEAAFDPGDVPVSTWRIIGGRIFEGSALVYGYKPSSSRRFSRPADAIPLEDKINETRNRVENQLVLQALFFTLSILLSNPEKTVGEVGKWCKRVENRRGQPSMSDSVA